MADRIVRERERREITGICRTTAYELEKKGQHPWRVGLTGGRVGWRLSELEAWIKSRRPVGKAA
jgi:prophage regulatory protein